MAYDDVITRAMAKRPDDRFDSVHAFLEAFRTSLHVDEPSESSSDAIAHSDPDGTHAVSCIGVYVDVQVAQDDIDEAEELLLDDIDAIFPKAARFLERRGFMLAFENGDSALFVLPLPTVKSENRQTRDRILQYARQLAREIEGRRGRHERIHVCLHLHVDQARIIDGLVADGPLLDITTWVAPNVRDGLAFSPAMTRDLSP